MSSTDGAKVRQLLEVYSAGFSTRVTNCVLGTLSKAALPVHKIFVSIFDADIMIYIEEVILLGRGFFSSALYSQ